METDSRYYVYLISSLPSLHLGSKGPFSFDKFLAICKALIPEEELELLKTIDLSGRSDPASIRQSTLKMWSELDRALRNELVKIRAGRKKLDPLPYLRQSGYARAHIYQAALHAYRNPSPLEGEKMLDQQRWRFLDELSQGHYFDFDTLIIYALKLLILEKWQRIDSADAAGLVETTLQKR